MKSFVIKGDICWSKDSTTLSAVKDGYLVCVDGVSQGVFSELPEQFSDLSVEDYTGKLVIPGMVDLHIHAPQYSFRGLGMDLELLEWLEAYTFPEEAKYADLEYAVKAYGSFVSHMKASATTRAVVFATVHRDATVLLMDMLEDAGLVSYVGKVNMDRNGPDDLCESGAEASAGETVAWLKEIQGRYENTMPILTPRFLPSCSDELLRELHRIQTDFGLPVQSHLSENPEEVQLVQRLFPDASCYGDEYDRYGLFGGSAKTVMGHCVYSTPEEVELLQKNGVFVAHCPASNMNLASGIAPIRRYLDRGICVGLGSDVAGGESESMFRAISDCVQVSKLYWRLVDQDAKPISFEEAFSLATVGGGRFFGNVGSFDPGFAFDALVLDDKTLCDPNDLTVQQRTQRAVYLEADCSFLVAKYVNGREILQKGEKTMSCYFMVDTYIDEEKGRGQYDEYIQQVKPIVESFGGEYLARTEHITSLHPQRRPQRVILIRFPSRQALHDCFGSEEYRQIMKKRMDSVDARAVVVEGMEIKSYAL